MRAGPQADPAVVPEDVRVPAGIRVDAEPGVGVGPGLDCPDGTCGPVKTFWFYLINIAALFNRC